MLWSWIPRVVLEGNGDVLVLLFFLREFRPGGVLGVWLSILRGQVGIPEMEV